MDRHQEVRRKHTAEQTQTNAQTDEGTNGEGGGDGGVRREATYSLCVCGGNIWLTLEETRGAASSTEEKRRKKKKREEFG